MLYLQNIKGMLGLFARHAVMMLMLPYYCVRAYMRAEDVGLVLALYSEQQDRMGEAWAMFRLVIAAALNEARCYILAVFIWLWLRLCQLVAAVIYWTSFAALVPFCVAWEWWQMKKHRRQRSRMP